MQTCDRCNGPIGISTMSMYNQDIICMQCSEEERLLDSYEAAVTAENEAVRAGNTNYPGVGLTADDQVALAKMREERSK